MIKNLKFYLKKNDIKLLFSGYGHANFNYKKTNKLFGDFLLLHFKDATSAERVMSNKNNLLINGCKFHISEQKVSICKCHFYIYNILYCFSHLKKQTDQKAGLGIERLCRNLGAWTTLFCAFGINHDF